MKNILNNIPFLLVGIFFGIIMTKGEVISWFRIHEMFRFESFHMYGIIGTAVVLSMAFIFLAKRYKLRTLRHHLMVHDSKPLAYDSALVTYKPLPLNIPRHIIAGSIFGMGWALTGCCPGPMYILLGNGYGVVIVMILGAVLGTFTYGVVRRYLPH
jgi:uncharacterized membrane protein YedE/YeeE